MRVLFFGRIADVTGPEVQLDGPPPADVAALRARLAERLPHAEQELRRPNLRACVGEVLVSDDHLLAGVDTVEFFPPVSGG